MEIRPNTPYRQGQTPSELEATRISRDSSQQQRQQARPDDNQVTLQVTTRPLRLILKVVLEKISDVFEVNDAQTGHMSQLDLTEDAAVAQVVNFLAHAFHTFNDRFADAEQGVAIDRFVTLAQQTISEALQEAAELLAGMHADSDATGELISKLDARIHTGLEHIAARIIL